MWKTGWNSRDFVARLDAGHFDGRLAEALLDLSPAQLQEVEWILLHSRTPQPNPGRSTALEDLEPNGRPN
jgi:hypothetical protein